GARRGEGANCEIPVLRVGVVNERARCVEFAKAFVRGDRSSDEASPVAAPERQSQSFAEFVVRSLVVGALDDGAEQCAQLASPWMRHGALNRSRWRRPGPAKRFAYGSPRWFGHSKVFVGVRIDNGSFAHCICVVLGGATPGIRRRVLQLVERSI